MKRALNSEVEVYQAALKDSGYTHTLKYTKGDDKAQKRRRRRNITWYNPPYNIATSTKVAKRFLNIVISTFSSNHPLRKIFNRNTIKVSYSCMPNIAATITPTNKQKLTVLNTLLELSRVRSLKNSTLFAKL